MKEKETLSLIKKYYNLLILCILYTNLPAQPLQDYSVVFPEMYDKAVHFISGRTWMKGSLVEAGLDADMAISVVFPEILRYSAIRNWVETKGLEVLYAQYGDHYADFSVGFFQMKPTFACRLEKDWNLRFSSSQHKRFGIPEFDTTDNPQNRQKRIVRLNDLQWEVKYLIIFMLLMDKNTASVCWKSAEEKIRYFATAYNTGYWKNFREIIKFSERKDFHTAMIRPSVCYQYADIAIDYYFKTSRK